MQVLCGGIKYWSGILAAYKSAMSGVNATLSVYSRESENKDLLHAHPFRKLFDVGVTRIETLIMTSHGKVC